LPNLEKYWAFKPSREMATATLTSAPAVTRSNFIALITESVSLEIKTERDSPNVKRSVLN
ncbi:MAG: hypothetical protein RI901_404, partial [Actinomycetota bacterium]